MNYKSYIAIFFAIVFFGKFLVMDSQILVTILDADEIAYVNPFCKKENAKVAESNSQEIFSEVPNLFSITIDTFCNAPFKFEVFSWDSKIIPEESQPYANYTPSLPKSAQERFYPPPKI